jgi:hypothetical protein
MHLNEPAITLDKLNEVSIYKLEPETFTVVDGFEKTGSPAVVVLNQPKI